MSQIREIVTKAIVGKGKKSFKIEDKILNDIPAHSILGCWVINHNFTSELVNDVAIVEGNFEVNVWYSVDNNSKTEVARKILTYKEEIKTKQVVDDYLKSTADIMIKQIQQPTCTDAKIIDEYIEFEIIFEMKAEVIGETKMQVSILNEEIELIDDLDDLSELDNINENTITE